MAKTKAEKITSIEEEIRQLENRRRQLVQEQKAQERKDRTKRLCRRVLDELTAQNAATAPYRARKWRHRGKRHPPSKQPIERRETAQTGKFYNGNGHCIYSYQIKMSKTLDISSLT